MMPSVRIGRAWVGGMSWLCTRLQGDRTGGGGCGPGPLVIVDSSPRFACVRGPQGEPRASDARVRADCVWRRNLNKIVRVYVVGEPPGWAKLSDWCAGVGGELAVPGRVRIPSSST